MKKPLSLLALAIMLSACSDGGSSRKPAPAAEIDPAGIWRGTMTSLLEKERLERCDGASEDAGQHEVLILVDHMGYARLMSEMGIVTVDEATNTCTVDRVRELLASGRFVNILNENDIEDEPKDSEAKVGDYTGLLDVYSVDPRNTNPPETLARHYSTTSGNVVPQDSMTGSLKFADLELFTFDVTYDQAASQRGASVADLAGRTLTDPVGNGEGRPLTLTFGDGTVEGGDGVCTYQGTFNVPEASLNIYLLNLTVASPCATYQGTYSGLAALLDSQLSLNLIDSKRSLQYNLQ